jgi:N-acyl homoserine lactone hydrolase
MPQEACATRLFAFHCGTERTKLSLLDPFDERCGDVIRIPYFRYLIEHPRGWLIFDTGVNTALVRDPVARVGADASEYQVELAPGQDVSSQLAPLDLHEVDVADVVLSHLHFDHAGGLESFKHAKVHLQEEEMAFARRPPEYQRTAYISADFEGEYDWNLLTGDHDLLGDGSVMCFRTPGHTPGHQSLLVRLAEASIILVGDAAYDRKKMEQRRLPGFLWNPDKLLESWDRLQEMQQLHGATLLFSHDRAYHKTIRLAPGKWYD